jgi:hypothetical protein
VRIARLALTSFFAILVAAACTPPSSDLPPSVADGLAMLAAQCTEAQGTPKTGDAVRRADLTGDSADDFVLFAGWIACENAWSIYGDREKFVAVYASDGRGGAAEAFAGSVYDAAIESAGGVATLWLGTSAERCGRPRAETFAEESFCDRPLAWNAAAARFDFAPLATVRPIE